MSGPAAEPGIPFRPWFKGRGDPVFPGATDAEDLALLAPAVEPVGAGRPPVAPRPPGRLEVPLAGAAGRQAASGWRQTRAAGSLPIGRAVVELEWGPMTRQEWQALRRFLVEEAGLGGGEGGAARAITIDVDGEGAAGSAVEVRILAAPDGLEQLLERTDGSGPDGHGAVYALGPVRAEEML